MQRYNIYLNNKVLFYIKINGEQEKYVSGVFFNKVKVKKIFFILLIHNKLNCIFANYTYCK